MVNIDNIAISVAKFIFEELEGELKLSRAWKKEVISGVLTLARDTAKLCKGTTLAGLPCARQRKALSDYCWQHSGLRARGRALQQEKPVHKSRKEKDLSTEDEALEEVETAPKRAKKSKKEKKQKKHRREEKPKKEKKSKGAKKPKKERKEEETAVEDCISWTKDVVSQYEKYKTILDGIVLKDYFYGKDARAFSTLVEISKDLYAARKFSEREEPSLLKYVDVQLLRVLAILDQAIVEHRVDNKVFTDFCDTITKVYNKEHKGKLPIISPEFIVSYCM